VLRRFAAEKLHGEYACWGESADATK